MGEWVSVAGEAEQKVSRDTRASQQMLLVRYPGFRVALWTSVDLAAPNAAWIALAFCLD
jgi:hypothetical protein